MTLFRGPSLTVIFLCVFMAIAIFGQRNTNICDWIQCANGGECQIDENSNMGYKCRCPFGFTGLLCEDLLNITTCLRNPCKHNGNCTITNDHQVKCTCQKGFTGARCEILI
ncbi:unnamed protein product [Rotaria sp. Silwood2]|nr:unnamed protein product [Rotaria sp. Silwood2]CAF2684883.1 unnamed protein product [Rotaria sp. Silwood2]CAF2957621.1 unnamed protein product [Rotaria sp. Silwood2]CAF3494893.1 unnamed protein product [Rotaria sp. Silwood2]CAF4171984.1 unnamed protein product [Rotaria sp. Silwood2]